MYFNILEPFWGCFDFQNVVKLGSLTMESATNERLRVEKMRDDLKWELDEGDFHFQLMKKLAGYKKNMQEQVNGLQEDTEALKGAISQVQKRVEKMNKKMTGKFRFLIFEDLTTRTIQLEMASGTLVADVLKTESVLPSIRKFYEGAENIPENNLFTESIKQANR